MNVSRHVPSHQPLWACGWYLPVTVQCVACQTTPEVVRSPSTSRGSKLVTAIGHGVVRRIEPPVSHHALLEDGSAVVRPSLALIAALGIRFSHYSSLTLKPYTVQYWAYSSGMWPYMLNCFVQSHGAADAPTPRPLTLRMRSVSD